MVFRFPSGLLPRPAPGSGPFPSASPCLHPPSTNSGPRGGGGGGDGVQSPGPNGAGALLPGPPQQDPGGRDGDEDGTVMATV